MRRGVETSTYLTQNKPLFLGNLDFNVIKLRRRHKYIEQLMFC